MKQIDTYKGKNVLVLGLGKSGFAVSKLLLKLGAKLTLNDKANLNNNANAKKLAKLGVHVIGGHHPVELLDQEHFDYFVKNPGIPYENPMVKKAEELKIPIITEPEIALSVSDAPYVCVTGSNGKTTTVMLTQRILDRHLQKTGHHAYAVGNIGVPISEVVPKATKDDILVVEISSFQLLGVTDIDPKVAAIVDIYNHVHLDYHKTFANYVNAKLNVTRTQTADDYFIANFDQKNILAKEKATTKAKIQTFSEKDPNADYFIGKNYLESKKEKIMKISDIKLPGVHNQQNALVAIAISKLMGADNEDIQAVLSTFTGAKHRLQYVMTLDGRKVYNDSKSTDIEAAKVAISSFDSPVVLIAGGLDRGFTFDTLVPVLKKYVKAIVLYGETKYLLADAARKAGIKDIVIENILQEAVPKAYELTKPGDVLLFSPACASWDQFKTFEKRGDYFVNFVKDLKTK
ncbi:UDP-N-acetylmuramoyl-L-alanine--D-glutamate ligase [Lactobacillus acetotolerans]|jgi:UDP-N-acetylmuramoylalanine--D-glutamate ligase|uniref:UDP-N-acetylmuramoylalanine--D-glutamate ligase n=1 Tax=Lactobacillus acetotolerans TaxID=1600 RepID=A0A0D6A3L0_9LACO|nr:UDP-N-acetylmuramoyl-L-alanine--D-glutamate ligase [Lactobacillus acetotolerans]KRN42023.1 UDP-N-acetylmuramoyl-L-alanine-D-glutamate ligase [Lactobacillus acetotolerans DSM 20749 = JCM 3825]MBN7276745.1 UDP-N-acetylmuramoyl-L-alanine--D-glutamate ligase [Lactobacillus acetotolerans]QFG51424.1 UDP-N-acetylmuramoyl-L-alanine--D-glutamate ligase [Lactobacillus acetotolerans]QJD73379.1 UDP-N-acetylmuramoyl-L-alanine--D-glutamate ligase [Lactobacillus acetotolerans]BAQ57412.1 UDP-N-acetylmuramo